VGGLYDHGEWPHRVVQLLCWGTGRERTQEEYVALLEKAGWKYVATWFPASHAMGVVEGSKL